MVEWVNVLWFNSNNQVFKIPCRLRGMFCKCVLSMNLGLDKDASVWEWSNKLVTVTVMSLTCVCSRRCGIHLTTINLKKRWYLILMHNGISFQKEILYLSCIFNVEFRVCYDNTALLQAQLWIIFKTVCLCLSETFHSQMSAAFASNVCFCLESKDSRWSFFNNSRF